MDAGEALGREDAPGADRLGLAQLPGDDLRRDRGRTIAVARPDLLRGRFDDDGVRRYAVALGQRLPRVAARALETGRVDDGRQAPAHPLGDDEVEDLERVAARAHVAL